MTYVPSPSGLGAGDYLELSIDEFRNGYDTLSAGLGSRLPVDPEFPTTYLDGKTGMETVMPDSVFNRAWFAAGKLFEDLDKRISFYARVERVMAIALEDKKYAKYVDREAGSFHIALFAAVAAVRFSARTTPKALRKAFAIEFRRCLAGVEAVSSSKQH